LKDAGVRWFWPVGQLLGAALAYFGGFWAPKMKLEFTQTVPKSGTKIGPNNIQKNDQKQLTQLTQKLPKSASKMDPKLEPSR